MNTDLTVMRKYVTQLLETYHKRARQIAVLRYELSNPQKITEDEMLDVMQFARTEGSGRTAGHISNKTLHIALNYREQAARINAESLDEISRELVSLMKSRIGWSISSLCWNPARKRCCVGPALSGCRRKR